MAALVKHGRWLCHHCLASLHQWQNFMPRIAALLDCSQISDITAVVDGQTFERRFMRAMPFKPCAQASRAKPLPFAPRPLPPRVTGACRYREPSARRQSRNFGIYRRRADQIRPPRTDIGKNRCFGRCGMQSGDISLAGKNRRQAARGWRFTRRC